MTILFIITLGVTLYFYKEIFLAIKKFFNLDGKETMKIMLLGYSNSGKTFFLGATYKLAYSIGKNGFTVQAKDCRELDIRLKAAIDMKDNVTTTNTIRHASLILREGVQHRMDIDVTDVVGQAIAAGGHVEQAGKTIKIIPEYDGFIITIKSPRNQIELEEAIKELAQCLQFVSDVLANKSGIPVVLVLTQIDELPEATGLKSKIEKEIIQEEESKNIGGTSKYPSRLSTKNNGKIIAPLITPVVCTKENYALIEQFYRFLRADKHDIANKVFFCTSTGFDSEGKLPVIADPYGTSAAFLWTIYASLKSKKPQNGSTILAEANESLAERLLEDIQALYRSGKAYFDDEHRDEVWHSRYIGYLYENKTWEKGEQ